MIHQLNEQRRIVAYLDTLPAIAGSATSAAGVPQRGDIAVPDARGIGRVVAVRAG